VVAVAVDTLALATFSMTLLRWRSGRTLAEAAAFANVAAALKCRGFGGRLGAPTREAVDALLAPTRER
jgi:sulfofructose kinase